MPLPISGSSLKKVLYSSSLSASARPENSAMSSNKQCAGVKVCDPKVVQSYIPQIVRTYRVVNPARMSRSEKEPSSHTVEDGCRRDAPNNSHHRILTFRPSLIIA